jgi:hypothetical protein
MAYLLTSSHHHIVSNPFSTNEFTKQRYTMRDIETVGKHITILYCTVLLAVFYYAKL